MVGMGVENRPPFTHVATHGWVLDGEGRAMHKSLGNVISPLTLIERHGADVVRWWALATDWRTDVRVSDEILQRVAEAYRKVRNTFRFLLGNLSDFRAADALPRERWTRVDRAFHDYLRGMLAFIQSDWKDLRFHRALDGVLALCTVDLSAVFLDVSKDRLYTFSPDDPARRSAQTVLWTALHDLLLAASPALVFTAEEAWQHHPDLTAEAESVHLATWAKLERDLDLRDEWDFLLRTRDAVNAAIEPLRAGKTLATTGEAEVTLTTDPATAAHLLEYGEELAGFMMVARAEVVGRQGAGELAIDVRRTSYSKCERCWTYREDVARDGARTGLCARCAAVLDAAGGPVSA
jgi:isoleucyl-tRNA synthetase